MGLNRTSEGAAADAPTAVSQKEASNRAVVVTLTFAVIVLFALLLGTLMSQYRSEHVTELISATANDRADLRAQQEMAEWALAMFVVTLAGFGASLAGLVYIVRAYRLNAAATDHARAAAEAATEQTKVAMANLSAERRPWVSIDDVRLNDLRVDNGSEKITIDTTIMLRNTGQSPALHVEIYLGATASLDPNEAKRRQDAMRARIKEAMEPGIATQTIFPGATPRGNQCVVSVPTSDLDDLFERWLALPEAYQEDRVPIAPSVFGVVCYRSAYDNEVHTTSFIVNYTGRDGRSLRVHRKAPSHAFPGPLDVLGRMSVHGWDAD